MPGESRDNPGVLSQKLRHMNFSEVVLGGGQKVHVEKVYVLFLSPTPAASGTRKPDSQHKLDQPKVFR